MKRFKKSILFSAAMFTGLVLAGNASANHEEGLPIEIGVTIMDHAIPAIPAIPATVSTDLKFAGQTDIPTSFIIDSDLVEAGEQVLGTIVTQADLDVLRSTTPDTDVKVGDLQNVRTATGADVLKGVMVNSDVILYDDLDASAYGHGLNGDSVIINMQTVVLGDDTFDRIATKADTDARVISSGTAVALGDPVFAGVATLLVEDEIHYTEFGTEAVVGDGDAGKIVLFRAATQADVDVSTKGSGKSFALNDKIVVLSDGSFVTVTKVNDTPVKVGQWVGERTAEASDVTANVSIDGGLTVVELGKTIPGRIATLADQESGAAINSTSVVDGDLLFNGYADADDVAAEKTTGNEFVKVGDTIFSRLTTVEDINAGAVTGSRIIKLSELIPGAVVVDQNFLDENPGFKIGDKAVSIDDVIILAGAETDAKAAIAAIPARLATAADVIDAVMNELPEEVRSLIAENSSGVSDENKITVIAMLTEKSNALVNAGIDISETDGKAIVQIGFALVHDVKAFNAYDAVMDSIIAGNMTMDELRTKVNPDVNSNIASTTTGVSVVNTSISNHQANIVASSGKYNYDGVTSVNAGNQNPQYGAWIETFISDSDMGTRDGVAGYDADTHGLTIGIDGMVAPDAVVGFALSYANISVDGKSTAESKTKTDQFQGTLYTTLMRNSYFLNGSLSYAHGSTDTKRTTLGGEATGDYGVDIFSIGLGAGAPIVNQNVTITPQISLLYSSVNPDSYTETGSGAMQINPENIELLSIKTGLSLDTTMQLNGASLVPKMRLIADWDILRNQAESTASWVSTGATIAPLSGPKPSTLGGIVGVGFDYATDDGIYEVSLDFDTTIKSDFISHAGTGKFRMNF